MQRTATLFERLAPGQRQGNPVGPLGDEARLRASILANLRRVLGTRQGRARAHPDLGTPSPAELVQDYPACIARLQKTIGACIQSCEPRLAAVRVHHLAGAGDGFTVSFQITAELADGTRTGIAFATRVDPDGRIEIPR